MNFTSYYGNVSNVCFSNPEIVSATAITHYASLCNEATTACIVTVLHEIAYTVKLLSWLRKPDPDWQLLVKAP